MSAIRRRRYIIRGRAVIKTPRKAASRRHRWCQRISELRLKPIVSTPSSAFIFNGASANDIPAPPIMQTSPPMEMARHYNVSARMASASANVPRRRCVSTLHSVITLSSSTDLKNSSYFTVRQRIRNTLTPFYVGAKRPCAAFL